MEIISWDNCGMKTDSKKRMAGLISVAVSALLVFCVVPETVAQSVLQKHLKTTPSPSPATNIETKLQSNGHEDLDATLWVRFAAEYKAITRQTFVAATRQLRSAILSPTWTALVTDSSAPSNPQSRRPVCVIMDVDETVLDNSAYQQELILNNKSFSGESWSRFVNAKVSPAVPGAKAFVDTCRRMGVTIFFVTNRDFSLETATRENLIAEGLMQPSDPEAMT